MIKASKFLAFVVLVNSAFGCFSEGKETHYYASVDYSSGVVLLDDSIRISSPYFSVTQAMGKKELDLPCTLSVANKAYDAYLELFPDSAVIYVQDARFLTYPQEMYRSRWDSVVIRQHPISRPAESLALMKIEHNGQVQIKGGWWSRNVSNCSSAYQLVDEEIAGTQLRTELDYISQNTFALFFSGASDLRAYLSVKKCLSGKCQVYEGDEVAANYQTLKQLLNTPSTFVRCVDLH